ncbi:aminotransferase class V-fold PLP-dependent enzyme [Frankia canadensis]|uniref:aminotransferase class V-fold PLP-dependent enzyme n=1 Tax=Frankia canadensis TaxID=1836972 RepID=UPI001FAEDBFC|nr:aminotransferase class V-fold PLP-dependent enzyme [Frankia canadensis]
MGEAGIIHLDAAGAARPSPATVEAQAAFLRAEGEHGAYVAELEAADTLRAGLEALAALLGPDLDPDGIAWHHGASAAFATLLGAWPLPARGGRVGVVPSEYGSNRLVLEACAARAGLDLLDLPVDPAGTVDLDRLDGFGLDRLDLVVFPQVPSQRGIVQPAAEIGRRCAAAGVPLVVDVAQSLGQVDTTGIGADAYVGTSRKWLRGPRGAGFVALRAGVADRLGLAAPSLHNARRAADGGAPEPLPGVARLGVGEASVAARVGLARALVAYAADDPPALRARIAALAAHGRRVLDGAGGWQVREEADSASGIITLRPPPGADPAATRDRLYRDARILTSAIPAARARDLDGPLLRASAHAYNDPTDLDRLAAALAATST